MDSLFYSYPVQAFGEGARAHVMIDVPRGIVAMVRVGSWELTEHFAAAAADMDRRLAVDPGRFVDNNQDAEVRRWLDGDGPPLAWTGPAVTADEWFFVTTLYGEMTLDGQRTHIRALFPRFVHEAKRDIRNFTPDLLADWRLRSGWMKSRLCRMGEVLRERQWTTADYVEHLQNLERRASPADPMPALDEIVRDHRATAWKTLSVFVRDCVRGNCFPIDSRVDQELRRFGLPSDERLLVSLSLQLGRNPRQIARMFYAAGDA